MALQGTYLGNIFSPPNHLEDLRRRDEHIFLGTFSRAPTDYDFNFESLRETVIKANFQAKTHIATLGDRCHIQKPASTRYSWEIIKVTLIYYSKWWRDLFISSLFVVGAGSYFKGGSNISETFLKDLSTSTLECAAVACLGTLALLSLGRSPDLERTKKPYFDEFVAFNKVSYLPNSMTGFDVAQLANNKREDGWDDPISLETITPDQISSTRILCVGNYAISITSAIQSMLTTQYRECPLEEIPHPVEHRSLTPADKDKFLREVSAFFAILDANRLEKCWKIQITDEDLEPLIREIPNWDRLPRRYKIDAMEFIMKQLRPIKRKQAFLGLLTDSVAKTYFDEDFRSNNIVIPVYKITPEMLITASSELLIANHFWTVDQNHVALNSQAWHETSNFDSDSDDDLTTSSADSDSDNSSTSTSGQSDSDDPL